MDRIYRSWELGKASWSIMMANRQLLLFPMIATIALLISSAAIGGVGGVCTRTCNDDCPPDWNCREISVGESLQKVCVPNAPQLCLACATDNECGPDAACLTIDGRLWSGVRAAFERGESALRMRLP